jgi:hypothetical protein
MIRQFFSRRVASEAAAARFAQFTCFAGACLIPVLVFWSFPKFELSEVQLLVCVIGSMSLALSFTVLGVLLEPKAKAT